MSKGFPKGVKCHGSMDIIMLKTPVGTDKFVMDQLDLKLIAIKTTIRKISSMPFKMEAFTLVRNCLTLCKVTHLMRTIPPRQIEKFPRDYDSALREGFEKLIDMKLEDKWWQVARLQSKHGGMGLRTGLHTTGAKHFSSLAKCSRDIAKFLPDWDGLCNAKESTGIG